MPTAMHRFYQPIGSKNDAIAVALFSIWLVGGIAMAALGAAPTVGVLWTLLFGLLAVGAFLRRPPRRPEDDGRNLR